MFLRYNSRFFFSKFVVMVGSSLGHGCDMTGGVWHGQDRCVEAVMANSVVGPG